MSYCAYRYGVRVLQYPAQLPVLVTLLVAGPDNFGQAE